MKTLVTKIGCRNAFLGKLTEGSGGSDTYAAPQGMSGMQSVKQSITVASADIKGDDAVLHQFAKFVKGAADVVTAGESDEILSLIGGSTIEDGEIVDSMDDSAPELGLGFIAPAVKKTVAGTKEGFYGYFFPKVTFEPVGEDITGQGENITPSNSALKATILANRAGKWRRRKFFDGETLDAAETAANAWVAAKFGATPVTP